MGRIWVIRYFGALMGINLLTFIVSAVFGLWTWIPAVVFIFFSALLLNLEQRRPKED